MVRRSVVGLLVVLAVLGVAGPALGGAPLSETVREAPRSASAPAPLASQTGSGPVWSADSSGPAPELAAPLTTPEGFNSTTFRIQVFENTSARWTIRHARVLENETERRQFEAFAESFNTNDTETFRDFRLRASRLTEFGTEATGRQMDATAFSRSARVRTLGQTRGVVGLSFVWTNFSRRTDAGVVVDDVFEGGMYVGSGQRLVVARGPGVTFESIQPDPDSRSGGELAGSDTVTWFGSRQFADNRPRLVFVPRAAPGTTTSPTPDTTPATTPTETPAAGPGTGGGSTPVMFVLVLVVLAGLVGGVAWYAGALDGALPDGDDTAGSTEGGSASAGTGTASAEPAVPEEELVSDEDRVIGLLEDNGGRMKQVNIVEETEWSKSKVSMLLSEMDEEGRISKLRVGRENIISLAGEEPDAFGSPFDEE